MQCAKAVKGKGFPYSLLSIGPGADPGVQAVSPQVTISHPTSGPPGLVSFPSPPLGRYQVILLGTEAHKCEQLAQGCYASFALSGI